MKRFLLAVALLAPTFVFAEPAKFQPGDRVECDDSGSGKYLKGVVVQWEDYDNPEDTQYYRVRLDSYKKYRDEHDSTVCGVRVTRAAKGAAAASAPSDLPPSKSE